MLHDFIIRKGIYEDIDKITAVMEQVKDCMENPEWFVADDRSWIETHIKEKGFIMLAEAETSEIAAFFIVAFPESDENNLGRELMLTGRELELVAHMDSAAVCLKYRGNHLQGRLLQAAEKELEKYPHQYFLCTVHPDNHASLHTMLLHGYVIVATKEKYHGRLRHILYKRKEVPFRDKPNVLVSACLLGVHCRYNEKGVMEPALKEMMNQANLIPVCPEILGGLATPRTAAERVGDYVLTRQGEDVTKAYQKGAKETLALAKIYGCDLAVLKERSPSCGCGMVYDGTFTGTLTKGDGVTAELLKEHGICVVGESEIPKKI